MTVADWPYSWFPLLAGVGGFSGFSAAAGDAAGSLALAIFTFLMTFGVGGLMVYHFGLISSGRTTYEDIKGRNLDSKSGFWHGLRRLWCKRTPPSKLHLSRRVFVSDAFLERFFPREEEEEEAESAGPVRRDARNRTENVCQPSNKGRDHPPCGRKRLRAPPRVAPPPHSPTVDIVDSSPV